MSRFSTLFFLLCLLGVNSQLPVADLSSPHTCGKKKDKYQAASCCGSDPDTAVALSKSLNCDIGIITIEATLLDPSTVSNINLTDLMLKYDANITSNSDVPLGHVTASQKEITSNMLPLVNIPTTNATTILYGVLAGFVMQEDPEPQVVSDAKAQLSAMAMMGLPNIPPAGTPGYFVALLGLVTQNMPSASLYNKNLADIVVSDGRSLKFTQIFHRAADLVGKVTETYLLILMMGFLWEKFEMEIIMSKSAVDEGFATDFQIILNNLLALNGQPPIPTSYITIEDRINGALDNVRTMQRAVDVLETELSVSLATHEGSTCATADKTYTMQEYTVALGAAAAELDES